MAYNFFKKIYYMIFLLILFSGLESAVASLPLPWIHLDFEDDLQNQGSLGETAYITWPNFVEGVALNTKALNLSGGQSLKLGQAGGVVQQALNGLKSFTICMWVKLDLLPGTRSYLWSRKEDSGPLDYVLRLYQDQWGRPRQTINMIEGTLDPYAYWGTVGKWQFLAITYDGTKSMGNELFFWKTIDDTIMRVVTRNHASGFLHESNSPIEFGTDILGMIDEIRFFGSKTDSSGVLTQSQLEEIWRIDQEYIEASPVFDDPFGALVYMSFDKDWNNHGSAQPDSAQIAQINGITPKFGSGIRKQGLDLSTAAMGKTAGCVNFGTVGSVNTPVEQSLNGLKSFTICGWFNTASPNNRLSSNTGFCGRLGQLMVRSYDNESRLVLGVNNQWTPVDNKVIFSEAGEWVFWAVSYDSTKTLNQVCWYKGKEQDPNGVKFLTMHTLSAGALIAKDDQFAIGNLLPTGAYSFSGFFDEFRFFGSKDNSSGTLNIEQLQAIYEYSLRPICGETGYDLPKGDANQDCVVDLLDFAVMASNWLIKE